MGALGWTRAPCLPPPLSHSPSPSRAALRIAPAHNSLILTNGRNASARKTRVSSQSSSKQESGPEESARVAPLDLPAEGESQESPGQGERQQEQGDIGEALRELRRQGAPSPRPVGFWEGLAQEIGMIEWPNPGKVFGTTLVVLGIIVGSSIVLLTVNFLLAELSDVVFKVQ